MQGNMSYETSFLVNGMSFMSIDGAEAEAVACGNDFFYEVSVDEDGKLVQAIVNVTSIPDGWTDR